MGFHSLFRVDIVILQVKYRWLTTMCKASLIAQLVKNQPECRRPQFDSWVEKISWRRNRLPTPVFLGFPCGSTGKESACNAEDLSSVESLGLKYPLEEGTAVHSMENSMDRGTWQATSIGSQSDMTEVTEHTHTA